MTAALCDLPETGCNFTLTEAWTWACETIREAREILGEGEIRASLWAYRYDGRDVLACDLSGDQGDSYPITITALGLFDLTRYDPSVPDMIEALHLAGMVISGLKATVTVGIQDSERNPETLATPLEPGRHRGKMRLP